MGKNVAPAVRLTAFCFKLAENNYSFFLFFIFMFEQGRMEASQAGRRIDPRMIEILMISLKS